MRSLVTQIQLALHRQLWKSELPFCLFLLLSHQGFSKRETPEYFSCLQIWRQAKARSLSKIVLSYLSVVNYTLPRNGVRSMCLANKSGTEESKASSVSCGCLAAILWELGVLPGSQLAYNCSN